MATQRIAVVTGGNKGIGYGIVKELCSKFNGRVYLTDKDDGTASVENLKKLGLSPVYRHLDIADQESINKFAAYIKDTYGGLDCLVNNAAIAYKTASPEPIGVQAENTVRVNYYGTRAVSRALFPLLRPHARVCHVSSSAGHLSEINGDEPAASKLKAKFASSTLTEDDVSDLMNQFVAAAKDGTHKQKGWPSRTYAVSKVGISALTRIHQRAFDSDPREDLVVNCCHPGFVDTDMSSHLGTMTIEEGAACPSYLALLPPNITEPKGCYLWHDKTLVDWTTTKPAPR